MGVSPVLHQFQQTFEPLTLYDSHELCKERFRQAVRSLVVFTISKYTSDAHTSDAHTSDVQVLLSNNILLFTNKYIH